MDAMDARPRHLKALETWVRLNDFLLDATVKDCEILAKVELAREGGPRPTFVNRIAGRARQAARIVAARARR